LEAIAADDPVGPVPHATMLGMPRCRMRRWGADGFACKFPYRVGGARDPLPRPARRRRQAGRSSVS